VAWSTARCCCGALQIRVAGEPVFNAICHCENCKRRTGGAFGWSCYYPEDEVEVPDVGYDVYAFESASGPQARRFCPRCGSTVFWTCAVFPGVVGVAGGCLTPSPTGTPNLSASDTGRCAWVQLPAEWARAP
jgi:hypothetical protein